MPGIRSRSSILVVVALGVLAWVAPVASAHVQVSPSVAAPGDPILVTITVPNERPQSTTKVTVKVPDGVIPFSFADTPGWRRRNVTAPNGALDQIEWTGKLPSDGFVSFQLLASTPDTPGTLEWKALQEYADGEVASWIGAPDSENPAPTMTIDADAARQNAGGEGAEASSSHGSGEEQSGDDAPDTAAEPDRVARGLALAAIAVGLIAITLVLLRGRPGRRHPGT